MINVKTFKNVVTGLMLFTATALTAQTNPTPQSLPYSQDFSGLLHTSTTYLTGTQGWTVGTAASSSFRTVAPTGDRVLIASSSASNNSGGVHNYNGKIGILPSGSVDPALAWAVNTTGATNIRLSYDIMTIRNPYDGTTNTKINEATIQYRIGTSGAFTNLTGIEYQNNTTLQTGTGITTPQNLQSKTILLPVACENQSIVQLRLVMRDVSGVGSRVSMAIDNITVCAETTFYADLDADTYGNAASSTSSCNAPLGYVANNTDCNDGNAAVHPGATEICNGIDDDCAGGIDNGLTFLDYYTDADGDGYGNSGASPVNSCSAIGGSVTNHSDCNDADNSIHPGAAEICNFLDDNCNGTADEGIIYLLYYNDADGDTYGAGTAGSYCSDPGAGFSLNGDDCNDLAFGIHPGVEDICNGGIDDDCDGISDEDGVWVIYYFDTDGDTYGDPSMAGSTCSGPPPGYVSDNTDCNDADASVHPGATEICNSIDDDCNAIIDDGIVFTTYFADADDDNYGDALNTIDACDGAPAGFVSDNTDCDDAQNTVYPGATEICDGLDNNCNGEFDEGTAIATITPEGIVQVCKGDFVTLNANTGAGYAYQWFKNGHLIVGATSDSYTTNKTGYFEVQVTVPGGCFAVSAVTTLSGIPAPNANITAPNGLNLCAATVKLKASYDASYIYQWYKDGSPVVAGTSFVYYPAATGDYYCHITGPNGCQKNTATLTVMNACRETELNQIDYSISPNPSNGIFIITGEVNNSVSGEAILKIYSIAGELISEKNIEFSNGYFSEEINAENLSNGIYLITMQNDQSVFTDRLVINK